MPTENITENEKSLIDQIHNYLLNQGYVTKSGRRAGLLDYTRLSRELGIDRGLIERKFNKKNRFTVPDLENLSRKYNISFLISNAGYVLIEANPKELELAGKLVEQSRKANETRDNVVFLQTPPPRHYYLHELKQRVSYLKELMELDDKSLVKEVVGHGDERWQEMPTGKKSEFLRRYVKSQMETLENSIREGEKLEAGKNPEK